MSTTGTTYLRVHLSPTTLTTYSISTYTSSVLNNADEYRLLCEAGASVTQKSSTAFQIAVAYSSPLNPVSVWLEFLRAVETGS